MHKLDFEIGFLLVSGVPTTVCWILKLQIDVVFVFDICDDRYTTL